MPTPQNNSSPGENQGKHASMAHSTTTCLRNRKLTRQATTVATPNASSVNSSTGQTNRRWDVRRARRRHLEAYALSLSRTTGEDGIAAMTARKYYDYERVEDVYFQNHKYTHGLHGQALLCLIKTID